MRVRLEPPPTYFVHVPKTGGISMGTVLGAAFRRSERVRLKPPTLAELTLSDLGRFRFYHAMHQGRTLLELTGRTDLTCITMLRDPVERSVSQILYLRRTVARIPQTFTAAYLSRVAPILHGDLSGCVHHDAFAEACDSQIRTLGILEDYTPLFKGSEDAASGRSVLRPYDLPPLMDTGDKARLLENARGWLREMAVVGITERYAESVLLACDALGVPAPAGLPRQNVNPQRSDLTASYRSGLAPKVIDRLEELTWHDRQLYAYALDLFLEQWARYRARPRRTYSVAPRVRNIVPGVRRVLRPLRNIARRMIGVSAR